MNIIEKFEHRSDAVTSLLCIGLDSNIDQIPPRFQNSRTPQFSFNQWIIEQTHPFAVAYKPNIAFYEARGTQGLSELKQTIDFLKHEHPDIVTICDAKRGDIGNTNLAYTKAIFDELAFDAITLHPYLGHEALQPFLDYADKGCIILCRTSNPGASEIQDLIVDGKPLWRIIAEKVHQEWNTNKNCMLVVGATYPEVMTIVRQITPDIPFLVPGIGTQGGDIQATVQAGKNSGGKGMIINVGRSIIFDESPTTQAQQFRDEINRWR